MWNYADILDHARPVPKLFPPLSREQRAAQFSPFKALTGFEDAVEEEEAEILGERRDVREIRVYSIGAEDLSEAVK